MFTIESLKNNEAANFWEWRNSPEFDQFSELLISMLLDENDMILKRFLNVGDEALAARMARLQFANSMRKFPASKDAMFSEPVTDQDLERESYA